MTTVPLLFALCLPLTATMPAANDLARMQGAWELSSETFSGKLVPLQSFHAVIERDTMTFYRAGVFLGRWQVVIDERSSPKGMIIQEERKHGPMSGIVGVERLNFRAVYSLEGTALRICYRTNDDTTPASLDGKGNALHLRVYRKILASSLSFPLQPTAVGR